MLRFSTALYCALATTCTASEVLSDEDLVPTVFLDELNMLQHSILKSTGFFVEKKSSLRLAVSGNPTTGYGWSVNHEMANGAFTVTEEYVTDPHAPGMVGVGGTYYFTIEAGPEEADGTISLAYGRSWEPAPVQSYEFPVHIF